MYFIYNIIHKVFGSQIHKIRFNLCSLSTHCNNINFKKDILFKQLELSLMWWEVYNCDKCKYCIIYIQMIIYTIEVTIYMEKTFYFSKSSPFIKLLQLHTKCSFLYFSPLHFLPNNFDLLTKVQAFCWNWL